MKLLKKCNRNGAKRNLSNVSKCEALSFELRFKLIFFFGEFKIWLKLFVCFVFPLFLFVKIAINHESFGTFVVLRDLNKFFLCFFSFCLTPQTVNENINQKPLINAIERTNKKNNAKTKKKFKTMIRKQKNKVMKFKDCLKYKKQAPERQMRNQTPSIKTNAFCDAR